MSSLPPYDQSILILDGSNFLYRAYHALPPLENSEGMPTGAIYGLCQMVKKLLKTFPCRYVVMTFDSPGKTHRHSLFAEYKAHRGSMPEDLVQQIEACHDIIEAMGVRLLMQSGVEADDLIASLAAWAQKSGLFTYIASQDKDLAQLVNQQVVMINPVTFDIIDEAVVLKKFGVRCEQIVDYLALIGDKSDNIPGVDKVGPKTAVRWLTIYGTIDHLLENIDQIGGKIQGSLREARDQLPLYRQLIQLDTGMSIDTDLEHYLKRAPHMESLISMFQKYEFNQLVQDFQQEEAPHPALAMSNHRCQVVTTKDQLTALQAACRGREIALHLLVSEGVIYCQITFDADLTHFIQVPTDAASLSDKDVVQLLQAVTTDPGVTLLCFDAKAQWHRLDALGVTSSCPVVDVMLQAYLLDSHVKEDLAALAWEHAGIRCLTGKEQLGSAPEAWCQTSRAIFSLYQSFSQKLTEAQQALLSDVELPIQQLLYAMERYGVRVDAEKMQALSADFQQQVDTLQAEAFTLCGKPFNLSSPQQLQEVLYTQLQLPIMKKTPKGQPSTDEDALKQLARHHPLPDIILKHRHLTKLKTTYTDKIPLLIDPQSQRVHCHYHQTGTVTGRLSCSQPNLQNIPVRGHYGHLIRSCFTASKQRRLISADYSQIELRIMAHLSGDVNLMAAFNRHEDIHRDTAMKLFKLSDPSQVDEQQRRMAKAINFGLIYGISAFGLAKQLQVPQSLAKQYITDYFTQYPQVQTFMEKMAVDAARDGYVTTLLGRRIHVPNIRAKQAVLRKAAERFAINAPMQGGCADIIKLAMLKNAEALAQAGIDCPLMMQVHDELVYEVDAAQGEQAKAIIHEVMEGVFTLDVPLIVNVQDGDSWFEAH